MTDPMRKFKVIHCLLPPGRAHEALDRLREELGEASVFFHHARGGGISTRKGRESFRFEEREIATVLAPAERADEIFEFLFYACGVNRPHSGMVLMEKTLAARPISLPEVGEA